MSNSIGDGDTLCLKRAPLVATRANPKNPIMPVMLWQDQCMSPRLEDCSSSSSNSSGHSSDEGDDNPVVLPQVLADLERFSREFGPSSLQVAETWNALGLIRCRMQKKYNDAIHCHQKALYIFQAASERSTECSPSVLLQVVVTLTDLGSCYELQQNHQAALQVYRKANSLIIKAPPGAIASHVASSCHRSLARVQRI
jgi:tetratricopeptide (TPR) repeat protein